MKQAIKFKLKNETKFGRIVKINDYDDSGVTFNIQNSIGELILIDTFVEFVEISEEELNAEPASFVFEHEQITDSALDIINSYMYK